MKKDFYTSPTAELFHLGQTLNLLNTSSPSDPPGGIVGPNVGDDLDDPANDYKE